MKLLDMKASGRGESPHLIRFRLGEVRGEVVLPWVQEALLGTRSPIVSLVGVARRTTVNQIRERIAPSMDGWMKVIYGQFCPHVALRNPTVTAAKIVELTELVF